MKKTMMFVGMLLFFSMAVNAQTYVGNLPGLNSVVEKSFTALNKPLMVFGYSHAEYDTNGRGIEIYDSIVLYSDNLQRYKVMDYPTVTEHRVSYTERIEDGEITSGDTMGRDYVIPCLGMGYLNLDEGGSALSFSTATLTQTLFNNDSKFEYILPHFDGTVFSYETFSVDYYSGDTIMYRKYHSEATGYDIFNEDGDVVATIRLGDGEYVKAEGVGAYIIKWGENYFFVGSVYRDNWRDVSGDPYSKYYFYRIDRQTQKIEQVASVPFSVRPTVMERGQEIIVELDENTNAREIDVVNTLGQTVKRVPLAAGQREVRINSAELGSGMNFINTRTPEGQGTVKIIVK